MMIKTKNVDRAHSAHDSLLRTVTEKKNNRTKPIRRYQKTIFGHVQKENSIVDEMKNNYNKRIHYCDI